MEFGGRPLFPSLRKTSFWGPYRCQNFGQNPNQGSGLRDGELGFDLQICQRFGETDADQRPAATNKCI